MDVYRDGIGLWGFRLLRSDKESPAARGERRLRSLRSQRIEIDVLH